MAKRFSSVEKAILWFVAQKDGMAKWLDYDRDGDVDYDDLLKFWGTVKETVASASETIEGWPSLSWDQKLKKIVDLVKKFYPKAKDTLIITAVQVAVFLFKVYKMVR